MLWRFWTPCIAKSGGKWLSHAQHRKKIRVSERWCLKARKERMQTLKYFYGTSRFTCGEQLLLGRKRDDRIRLLNLSNALFPANERLALQLQRVRTAKPQQQRSGSFLFPLGQGESSDTSTWSDIIGGQRHGGMGNSRSYNSQQFSSLGASEGCFLIRRGSPISSPSTRVRTG